MNAMPQFPPVEAFRAAILEKLGHDPGNVIGDGEIRRFSTGRSGNDDAGWYVLHDDEFPTGSFGDWRTAAKFSWSAQEARQLTPDERQRLEQLEIARAEKREAAHQRAAEVANEQWSNAKQARPEHPYLASKGVGAHGLRERDGQLLVPLTTDGETIVSLQAIDGDGNKRFSQGGRAKGCYFPIGETGDTIVVGEGYATCATIYEATGLFVIVAFNAGNLKAVARTIQERFPSAHIIIAADDDYKTEQERGFNPGVREAKKAAAAVNGIVAVPPFDREKDGAKPSDWNDFLALRGKVQVAIALKVQLDEAEIARLAMLDPISYDRARAEAAEALGIRVATLDGLVAARREDARAKEAEGLCADIEPSSEPVDLAELLSQVRATIQRFIVCAPETATAATLWIAFTWIIEHVQVAPLAIITAPEKRCGKTQLLELIGRLSKRPLSASNISPAAVFRVIEAQSPTLLIDEADTFFRIHEELRGILNSGHTKSNAYVIRTVGDDHEPKRFSTWGAKAIAGIGKLADTVMDRAIILSLRRKLPNEKVERLRYVETGLFEMLARKLARFGEDHGATIGRARPSLPGALNDRAQDNWEPLLAIADLAGGNWPSEARTAALAISGDGEGDLSTNEELLSDTRDIFNADGVDRISLANLRERLCADDTAPWATWSRGKPISVRQLGKKLAEFGVIARPLRVSGTTQKGFERSQFEDAWRRYLGGRQDFGQPPVTPAQNAADGEPFVTREQDVPEEKPPVASPVPPNPLKKMDCNRSTEVTTGAGEEGSPTQQSAEKGRPGWSKRI
jgi:putative DNA primase/helicase